MEMSKYPRPQDIDEHRKQVWTSMLQYVGGYVPIENVEATIRALLGDAVLLIRSEHKELDVEAWKEKIASLKLTT